MTYKFQVDRIDCIEVEGGKRFEYLEALNPIRYNEQCARFVGEFGRVLPSFHTLDNYGRREDLRVIVKKITVLVGFADSSWVEFEFQPGFITDFGSVPPLARSIIDQDDARLVLSTLPHDYLFSTHDLPFKYTNTLFHRMLLSEGMGSGKAALCWLSVSSPFGRYFWRKHGKKRRKWTEKTATMRLPRPIEVGGKMYRGR